MSKITKLAFVALALGVPARYFIIPPPSDEERKVARLQTLIERVTPLHQALGKPQPGDWLITHPEPGQTFAQYLQILPVTAEGKRRVIYVRPLGDFTESQDKIVTLTADFMHRYFDLPVKLLPKLPLSVIPRSARRGSSAAGDEQILTTYVLDSVLKPDLPADAAATIAFTASDLWPGEGWNFVFGQASSNDRVGVWSISRNGDPDAGEAEFRLCLLRAHKDRHARDRPHVHSVALHSLRVQHVRQQQPQRERSSPRRSLSGVSGENLLGHRLRSGQTVSRAGRFLSAARFRGRTAVLRKIAGCRYKRSDRRAR